MLALPNNIEELVLDILVCGKVSDINRYQLKNALLASALNEEEQVLINRVLYGVRKGLLKVEC
jgi:hypothetical protein